MHYGLVRSIMEPLRDSSYILGDAVPWSFVFSLLMFFAGERRCSYFCSGNNKRKEGVLFGSANGDPYGITDYIRDNAKEVAYLDRINMMCTIFPENYVKPAPESERKRKGKEEVSDGADKTDETGSSG